MGIRDLVWRDDILQKDQVSTEDERSVLTEVSVRPKLTDPTVLPVVPVEPVKPAVPEDMQEDRAQVEQMERELLSMLFEAEPQQSDEPAAKLRSPREKPAPRTAESAGGQEQASAPVRGATTDGGKVDKTLAQAARERIELHAKAKEILGPHKDFASLAQARYDEYVRTAREQMKQKRYYQAADGFTLALVWKGTEPQAWVGRGVALFGAGSYMSAWQSLEKAARFRLRPPLSRLTRPRCWAIAIHWKDRLIEMETWQQKTKSPELAILMVWVFYQDDKPDDAREVMAQIGADAATARLFMLR